MARLYSGYTVPGLPAEQRHCPPFIVQCPNCTSRFYLSPPTFIFPQRWPQNVTYSQGSYFQYVQPFIHYPSPRSVVQSAFHPPNPSNCYAFGVNQKNQEITDRHNSAKQYVSQHNVDVNDMFVRRIRDILIDILNSSLCKYGVTICQLMVLLKQSCANYNVILPSSITDDFKEFLRYEMTDYVEVEDDLCRYRRSTLSIEEENIPSSSICEKTSNCFETPPAALASQKYAIEPAVVANESYSTMEEERLILEEEIIKESIAYKSAEDSSCSSTDFHDNMSKQYFAGTKEHHRNDDDDKRLVNAPVFLDDDKKCNVLRRHVESNAMLEGSNTRNDITKIMEEWKEIFTGDLKELIRYLRMVDDYFQESDGKFTLSKLKELFGDLNERWEFCDVDLVEMGIINFVHGVGLNKESVLIVNPIIREVKFPEVAELAKEIFNLLAVVNFMEVELIVRALSFGTNNKKTIDEKYALLWEVFSDSQFQDVFFVDILRKQNEDISKIFAK